MTLQNPLFFFGLETTIKRMNKENAFKAQNLRTQLRKKKIFEKEQVHEKSEDQQNPRNIEIIHDAFFDILTWVTKRAREN